MATARPFERMVTASKETAKAVADIGKTSLQPLSAGMLLQEDIAKEAADGQ